MTLYQPCENKLDNMLNEIIDRLSDLESKLDELKEKAQ